MKYVIEHELRHSYQRVLTIVEAENISDAIEKLMDAKDWVGKSEIFSANPHLELKEL